MPRPRPSPGLLVLLACLAGIAAVAWVGFSFRNPPHKDDPPNKSEPPAAKSPGPVDEEVELRPGLLAEYRSLSPNPSTVVRIDPKPAFTWGASSPHPRIAPGTFEATWTGVVELREDHPISFGAFVSGEVDVWVDGAAVLHGRGDSLTSWVQSEQPLAREPGRYRLKIHFRSLAGVPARLQVCWEGKSFVREPLPATRLKHIPRELPAALAEEERSERGRKAVARLGCARCHAQAFPGVSASTPGPALADLGKRIERPWLVEWLAHPDKVRAGARMPALFTPDRAGLAERRLVAEYLLGQSQPGQRVEKVDHRQGKQAFVGLGCVACHDDPEKPAPVGDPERISLTGLADRMTTGYLQTFLHDPATRYPDGRMPKLPVQDATARNIGGYLLLWSKAGKTPPLEPATQAEVLPILTRLGADRRSAGAALVREKGCARCHTGLGEPATASIPIGKVGGCLDGSGASPKFALKPDTRESILAYLKVAGSEKHSSGFSARQGLLRHLECHRCHQRDGERAAPLEEIGRTLHVPFRARLPFQRTPRLTQAASRLRHEYLLSAVRDGVSGVRPDWYSYRMPSFGKHAEEIVRALAEGDGELPHDGEKPAAVADPTLAALGPVLVGFEGYSCASCHIWDGKELGAVEPGTVGPEMTTLTKRIRREWFDRFLDDPLRIHPGTPMPAIFKHGAPAQMKSVLGGDAGRQKDAIWSYLAQGKSAPGPKPRPPLPIESPAKGALVSQVPLQLPDSSVVESICVVKGHDAIAYDLGRMDLANVYTAARLLRQSNVWRSYQLAGAAVLPAAPEKTPPLTLTGPRGVEQLASAVLHGYDRLDDGVRIRWRWKFASADIEAEDSLRLTSSRKLVRELRLRGMPSRSSLEIHLRALSPEKGTAVKASAGRVESSWGQGLGARFFPDPATGVAEATISFPLPEDRPPPPLPAPVLAVKPDEGQIGPLERPGYRAILYPRPKTSGGEDLVMPSALAVNPSTGKLFVASMKLGDLFRVDDPHDNGKDTRFERYANGIFQDVFGMLHDGKHLFVLHRRNLSRLVESDSSGRADRCERVAGLGHSIGNSYDWAYGLTRDKAGRFLYTFAPHANREVVGAGSLVRLPAKEEIAFGFRNPLGWSQGPDGEVFFTDNQGDWVATNKLCHIVEGKFYGYPNAAQRKHAGKPMAPTAVWVPYGWARSINGVAWNNTGGRFGPFSGQFFLAELMHGGGIIRANVEKVNGVYQGACFPFWGKGLLGPLTLAFDPKGRLYVGAITTPGWMGQPDRGALFRIDFTGAVPFEIQSIHARSDGFRLVFTRPVDATTARQVASYRIEHYRYEYTGAYGSPELDRTGVVVRKTELHPDGRTVDVTTAPLVAGRVYSITAGGVRSTKGEPPLHPTGVYTLNEVPAP